MIVKEKTKKIHICFPPSTLEQVDYLLDKGLGQNRSDLLRKLVTEKYRDSVKHEFIISETNRGGTKSRVYAYCNCKDCDGKVICLEEIIELLNKNV